MNWGLVILTFPLIYLFGAGTTFNGRIGLGRQAVESSFTGFDKIVSPMIIRGFPIAISGAVDDAGADTFPITASPIFVTGLPILGETVSCGAVISALPVTVLLQEESPTPNTTINT